MLNLTAVALLNNDKINFPSVSICDLLKSSMSYLFNTSYFISSFVRHIYTSINDVYICMRVDLCIVMGMRRNIHVCMRLCVCGVVSSCPFVSMYGRVRERERVFVLVSACVRVCMSENVHV